MMFRELHGGIGVQPLLSDRQTMEEFVMDDTEFDALIGALGAGSTRRGVLGILAGVAGLGLSGVAAKRRHRRSSHRDKPTSRVIAAAQDHEVTICHRTGSKKKPYQVITVDAHAVPAHEGHGDIVCRAPHVLAVETCTCVCDDGIACTGDEVLDPVTCRCVPRPGPTCTPACLVGGVCVACPSEDDPSQTKCCSREGNQGECSASASGPAAVMVCGPRSVWCECTPSGIGAIGINVPCGQAPSCVSDQDCPGTGETCIYSHCCERAICVPPC